MSAEALARRAGLLAERSRAEMCLALLDGRAWTAHELARQAGIAQSTASAHITALVDGGLLSEVRQGRHRYLRLAGPDAAQLVEDLSGPSGSAEQPVGLRRVRAAARLAAGRTCYDHLAGDLGVGIHDALTDLGVLTAAGLTDRGRDWFADLLGPGCLERRGRRPLVRECLDWTGRVPHLGGALAADLCAHLFAAGWVRRPADDRAVVVTPAGRAGLHSLLGL